MVFFNFKIFLKNQKRGRIAMTFDIWIAWHGNWKFSSGNPVSKCPLPGSLNQAAM